MLRKGPQEMNDEKNMKKKFNIIYMNALIRLRATIQIEYIQ